MERAASSSIILNFTDRVWEHPSSILLIFARNQYEQYRFLGATQQSYFIVFQSELAREPSEPSMLVIRHYRFGTLALLNEQVVSVPVASDCLQGFCSNKAS